MMLSLPLGWLKNTNRDQWMSHVLCWSDWRGELTDCGQRTHRGHHHGETDSDDSGRDRRSNCTKWSCRHIWHFWDVAIAIHTLLSMVSRSRVRSSMAASQFCMRISEASFPHSELKAFRSVEGTWKKQEIQWTNQSKTDNNQNNVIYCCGKSFVLFIFNNAIILTRTRKKYRYSAAPE